ncbi:hypothetical protein KC571_02875, partial [candidate division WWE3 bacterium]|nr:hypothetical protein [candidate division WWE3 bacterium]
LEDFVVGLSPELKSKKITITGISPSDTATEAYAQHFPQYLDDAIDPLEIANFVSRLCQGEISNASGEIFVLKKDSPPTAYFHY